MTNEPFGRQPKPVIVTIDGEQVDVFYWLGKLGSYSEFKGDSVIHESGKNRFHIYPRAVND